MSLRKGHVTGIKPNGSMGIRYHDGGASLPVPRTFLGGVASGFHVGAAQHDQVVVLSWGPGDRVSTAVAMTDHPEHLDVLAPGEPRAYNADGTTLLAAPPDKTFTLTTMGGASLAATAAGTWTLAPAGGQKVLLPSTVQQAASSPTWSITSAGKVTAAGGYSIDGAHTMTGVLLYSGTVSVTLAATTFTNPTYNAPTFTTPTLSGGGAAASGTINTFPTTSFSVFGFMSSSSGSFVATGATGLSNPPSGGTSVVTGITWTPPSVVGGSVGAVNSVNSSGSVSIGTGTLFASPVTVTGARPGDFVQVSVPALATHTEVRLTGVVTANDSVQINYTNTGTSTVVLSAATVKMLVMQAS